jgi:hypothetical protein
MIPAYKFNPENVHILPFPDKKYDFFQEGLLNIYI